MYGFIGDHNADMKILPPNRIPINNFIDTVILHPNWNRTTRNADIALIRLKTDLIYNGINLFASYNFLKIFVINNLKHPFHLNKLDYVSPVCLPNSADLLLSGLVTVAGWGTSFKGI